MFTGLIEDLGRVANIEVDDTGARITIQTRLASELAEGESIAVNGVCLTARRPTADGFDADVVNETLRRSSLGDLVAGSHVNLELAMRADGRFGGHIVQGHVDGVGEIVGVRPDGFSRVVRVQADETLLRHVVEKGSIAIDGVSLTVAAVDDDGFEVALIPETLERTRLGEAEPGQVVNLETDLFAKYAARLAGAGR